MTSQKSENTQKLRWCKVTQEEWAQNCDRIGAADGLCSTELLERCGCLCADSVRTTFPAGPEQVHQERYFVAIQNRFLEQGVCNLVLMSGVARTQMWITSRKTTRSSGCREHNIELE